MSSIEDREDLDFHDDTFIQHGDESSISSSGKSLTLRLTSNSSDQIVPPRKSSDSSLSFHVEDRPTSSTLDSSTSSPDEKTSHPLASPKGVSVGGGQAKISKFPERSGKGKTAASSSIAGEAQAFFTRAITGIRSGSQGNVLAGNVLGSMTSLSSSSSSGSGGKEHEGEDRHMDFFSRALTGIRSSPHRGNEDKDDNNNNKSKANKLEHKLQQMALSTKRFDNRLMELERQGNTIKPKEIIITNLKCHNNNNSKPKEVAVKKRELFPRVVSTVAEDEEDKKEEARRGSSQVANEVIARLAPLQSARRDVKSETETKTDSKTISTTVPSNNQIDNMNTIKDHSTDVDNSDGNGDSNIDNEEEDHFDEEYHDTNVNLDSEEGTDDGDDIDDFTHAKFSFDKDSPKHTEFDQVNNNNDNNDNNDKDKDKNKDREGGGVKMSSIRLQKQKQYSYEDLRRKSVKLTPETTYRGRSQSVAKQFSQEVVSVFADREDLLQDAEFESIFGMSKEKFKELPKWRRQELKKRFKLF
jgi:hypothetical protein